MSTDVIELLDTAIDKNQRPTITVTTTEVTAVEPGEENLGIIGIFDWRKSNERYLLDITTVDPGSNLVTVADEVIKRFQKCIVAFMELPLVRFDSQTYEAKAYRFDTYEDLEEFFVTNDKSILLHRFWFQPSVPTFYVYSGENQTILDKPRFTKAGWIIRCALLDK